jgi:hypothetical protein
MKPSVADKGEKTSSKSGPKVFDVAHPGKSKPSASSRPIIVTNRPILQDPMMNTQVPIDVETIEKESPAAVKIRLKPLDGEDDAKEDSLENTKDKDKPETDNRTIAVLAAEKAAEKAGEKAEEKEAAESEPTPEDSSSKSEPEPTDETVQDDAPTETAESETAAESNDSEASDDNLPVEGSDKDAKETLALEAIAKKQEEINGLVESREYFLPINAVERRRSKVVSILGLLLIVALGLMLVDLLLDVGFIRLGGVHSLTHFFSS